MSLDSGNRVPGRGRSSQDLWPKWMWVAVPVLVVVVVAGLWWAVFSPTEPRVAEPTPTATLRVLAQPEDVDEPEDDVATLPTPEPLPTREVLPLPTFTPSTEIASTPLAPAATVQPNELEVGLTVRVSGTGGAGLNMRSDAGTTHARVKTLAEGATVEIIGGPKDADGYTWWEVRDTAGISGWVVARYLTQ